MTFLSGGTRIAKGCEIGPATRIVDASVGEARSSSSRSCGGRGSVLARRWVPTRVRPGTKLGADAKVGAFVEVKGSDIGEGGRCRTSRTWGMRRSDAEPTSGPEP